MRTVWLCLAFIGLASVFPAAALADCQCVAAGKKYHLGEVTCLSLPEGDRLARCSMVLNNSSWTRLQESCPIGFDEDIGMSRMVASVAAPESHSHDHSHVPDKITDH